MSSLRRDLIERRLWPLVVLLLIAVGAVPVVLLKGSPAAGDAAPLPPSAPVTATTAGGSHTAPSSQEVQALVSRIPRNPFSANNKAALASTPASGGGSTGGVSTTPAPSTTSVPSTTPVVATASAPAASSSSSAASTPPAAMVSPSPSPSSSPSTSHAAKPATQSNTSTTSTPGSTATTAKSTSPPAKPQPQGPWTVYSVSLRFGSNGTAPLERDVPRLRPYPSASHPEVMFVGVFSGGTRAVFALATGVQHSGTGLCRPSRSHCTEVLLKAGQTEHLTIPKTSGGTRQVILHVGRISRSVTHSLAAAKAAYNRYSVAGLCELELANPLFYNQAKGTVTNVARAACRGVSKPVPFVPAASGS